MGEASLRDVICATVNTCVGFSPNRIAPSTHGHVYQVERRRKWKISAQVPKCVPVLTK
jgi:hypothetical protein